VLSFLSFYLLRSWPHLFITGLQFSFHEEFSDFCDSHWLYSCQSLSMQNIFSLNFTLLYLFLSFV
jgi:hypothetical protein